MHNYICLIQDNNPMNKVQYPPVPPGVPKGTAVSTQVEKHWHALYMFFCISLETKVDRKCWGADDISQKCARYRICHILSPPLPWLHLKYYFRLSISFIVSLWLNWFYFIFSEMHDKLSKKEEQCTSLSTESEALRSQLTGEHELEIFVYFSCNVILSNMTAVQYIEE